MLLMHLCETNKNIKIDKEDLLEWGFKEAHIDDMGYVRLSVDNKRPRLHQAIMGFPNCEIDHKNRIRLDNRKENLRPATNQQNGMNKGPQSNNTSGYKGVSWESSRSVWVARIKVEATYKVCGRYKTAEEAAKSYDFYAKIYHGEFAYLNFPEEN